MANKGEGKRCGVVEVIKWNSDMAWSMRNKGWKVCESKADVLGPRG